ncbi:MAG: lipopolysaccharide biosynthesis protein [Oscillospiraceae bacterium]|jgi:O-antigen/teichoic acid export membrane protein|nr:lipopolysaccharide biosynthesis protein [Oscillospiraceae bacterium]
MDRKNALAKNILIFGLGTSLSKLMSVLLIGLYTAYITADDLGYYDILITVILMATPMVTLQITDALYRHLLELRDGNDETDATRVLSGAFAVVAGGLFLAVVVLCILNMLAEIRLGWILPGYFVTSVMLVFSQQAARGLRRNTVYALSGVTYTGVMLAANLIFIITLGVGVEALLYSVIIADVFAILLIECTVGVYRRVRFSLISFKQVREMCHYSVPLLPHAVIWPVMMVVNRYAILHFEGLEANGLFAAASKFPALLMTVYNIFGLAWQENAILEYGSHDRNEYYTKTFRMYVRLLSGTILLLLPATRHIVSLLLHESYYDAWQLIPLLYMGSMFQAFSNFYATVYMGAKRTMGLFVTTMLGVGGGITVCLLTIPYIGAQAASLAHMTAFLLAWLLRVVHTRRYAKIELNPPILLLMAVLSTAYIYSFFRAVPMADLLLFLAAIPIFIWLNRDLIRIIIGMAKGALRKKEETV